MSIFNIFKRTNKQALPPFESLSIYPHKDKYFYRVASWYPYDGKNIAITDPHGPRVITLDPWPQIIFISAKGKMTVQQYVADFASKYTSQVPPELADIIIHWIDQLLKERLIALSDVPVDLNPLHDKSIH